METQVLAERSPIRPIALWKALLIFGCPGLLICLGVHFLVPRLVEAGCPLVFAWSACVLIPTMGNAVVVVSYYAITERPSWGEFADRFRLRPSGFRWWYIPLFAVLILIGNEMMASTIPMLQQLPGFGLPPIVPEIFVNPYESVALESAETTFFGVPLEARNWWLVPFWLIWVVGGVLGEELIWRGYVLPRQEVSYGRWAWLANGLLWNIPFHLYTLSHCLSDLPFYLLLPYLAQRFRSTWFAIGVHALLVSLAYVLIVPALCR